MDENKDKQKNKDFIINEESKNELCHLPEKISISFFEKSGLVSQPFIRFSSSARFSSVPGLPSRANMFFL